ncbi:hypothetical protein [Desulfoluna limicola]|uniref:hypothetical protein n=1 Tax=Desulfoluna limicola TaxID=2810562 RepID=UPI001F43B49F|nr:hypothetical protein [Desulfoluna limicola]
MKHMKSLKAAPPQNPFLSSAFLHVLHALHGPCFSKPAFEVAHLAAEGIAFLSVFLSGLTSAMSKANTLNQEPRTFLLIHEQRTCHDVGPLCFMAITFKLVKIRDM